MASFDTASKKQVETNPQDFIDLCFNFGLSNTTVLELVTPEQPTVEMHQADILIKALYNDREVLVHFEFQTTDSYDPVMPLRMAGYIIRAIEVYRLPVYSNVVYLRPDVGRNDPGRFEQNLENHRISIEYKVFRLIEIDGQEILDLKSVGLIPFTPLMKRPSGISSEQWLRRCVVTADSIDVENKPEYLGSLAILGNLVYDSQMIFDIITEETMQQPSIIEFMAPEAHEKGIQKGIQETTRKYILEVLKLRLRLDALHTFKPMLESIDDLEKLEQLFEAAMQVETSEDFERLLKESTE